METEANSASYINDYYFLQKILPPIIITMTKYAQKLFAVTDLVSEIGKWKSMFEHQDDIQRINNTYLFQHLVPLIFFFKHETGITKYNAKNDDRIQIQICRCDSRITVIQMDLYHKRKRIAYYHDSILLNNNEKPIVNQRKLAEWILNDSLLLDFFKSDGKII